MIAYWIYGITHFCDANHHRIPQSNQGILIAQRCGYASISYRCSTIPASWIFIGTLLPIDLYWSNSLFLFRIIIGVGASIFFYIFFIFLQHLISNENSVSLKALTGIKIILVKRSKYCYWPWPMGDNQNTKTLKLSRMVFSLALLLTYVTRSFLSFNAYARISYINKLLPFHFMVVVFCPKYSPDKLLCIFSVYTLYLLLLRIAKIATVFLLRLKWVKWHIKFD